MEKGAAFQLEQVYKKLRDDPQNRSLISLKDKLEKLIDLSERRKITGPTAVSNGPALTSKPDKSQRRQSNYRHMAPSMDETNSKSSLPKETKPSALHIGVSHRDDARNTKALNGPKNAGRVHPSIEAHRKKKESEQRLKQETWLNFRSKIGRPL